MAYTYDEFLNAANASGVMNRFSQDDLTVAQKNPEYGLSMVSLMKDISGANTPEQRLLATERANQFRKNNGVYGTGSTYATSYGSQIDDLMGKVNNYGSFQYGNQDAYQQLLDSVVNQQSFSYDAEKDPTFSAYKKSYLREGDRAAANALAQASAASGGQASSYAVQAAQQANNYYAGQLADMIPTLQQNAYSQYLNDFSQKMNQLGALENDRAFAYQGYQDQYDQLVNALGNLQNQDETDYARYLDQVAQQQQQEQMAQNADQLKYENALALFKALGYATPEVAEILGISAGGGAVAGSDTGFSGVNGSGNSTVVNDGTVDKIVDENSQEDETTNNITNATGVDANGVEKINVGGQIMDWSTLAKMIAIGKVKEIYNPATGKYTYQYVGDAIKEKPVLAVPAAQGSLNVLTAQAAADRKNNTPHLYQDSEDYLVVSPKKGSVSGGSLNTKKGKGNKALRGSAI